MYIKYIYIFTTNSRICKYKPISRNIKKNVSGK